MGKHARVIDRDHGWKRLISLAEAMKGGSYARVGVLADEAAGGLHERDPVTGRSLPLTVAELAAVLEYGTQDGHIPSRPFLRMTFDAQVDELARMAKLCVLKILTGDLTVGQSLGMLGAQLAAEVKKTVTAGPEVPPHNAESTLARKLAKGAWNKRGKAQRSKREGGAELGPRTLVDTGRMIGAVTWQVIMGGVARGMGAKSG